MKNTEGSKCTDHDNRDAQHNHRQYRRSHPYASASASVKPSSSAQTGVTSQASSVQTLRIEKRGHCFVSKLKFPVNNRTSTPSPPPLPSSSSPPQTTSPKPLSLPLSPTPQSLNMHDSGTTQQQHAAMTMMHQLRRSSTSHGSRSSTVFHGMNDDDRAVDRQSIETRSHLKNLSEKGAVIEMSSSLVEEEEKGKDQEQADKQQEEQPQRGKMVSVDYTQCDWLLRAFQENSNIP